MPLCTGLLNFPITLKERREDTVLIREVLCYPVLSEVKSLISLRTCLVVSKGNFSDNALLLRDTDLICFGWVKSSSLPSFISHHASNLIFTWPIQSFCPLTIIFKA